jgi:hypothetical protein
MQTRQKVLCPACQERERNEELVGVLTAISIVSKRLAGRIAALERKRAAEGNGGEPNVQNKRT